MPPTYLWAFCLIPLTRISLGITSFLWARVSEGLAALVDSMCNGDDSVFPLNGMHGKLSKEYLDKFPEDRSAEDIRLPAGTVFSPGKRTQGRAAIPAWFNKHGEIVDWLGLV